MAYMSRKSQKILSFRGSYNKSEQEYERRKTYNLIEHDTHKQLKISASEVTTLWHFINQFLIILLLLSLLGQETSWAYSTAL